MMFAEWHTNPTQVTGLLAFALAAAACVRTALAAAGDRRRLWWWLAGAQGACLTEILIGLRHRLHDGADALLQAHGWYASRSGLQMGLLIGLLIVALLLGSLVAVTASRWRRVDPHANGAVAASLIATGLFIVEAISLHGIDTILYVRIGPILLIALLWTAAAILVAVSAWRSARDESLGPGSSPAAVTRRRARP